MGKVSRSARLDPALDEKLVARAALDDVALQVVIVRALEEYLGHKSRPEQAAVPDQGPASLFDKTAGQTADRVVTAVGEQARVVRQGSVVRCQCVIPNGSTYCLTCNKVI